MQAARKGQVINTSVCGNSHQCTHRHRYRWKINEMTSVCLGYKSGSSLSGSLLFTQSHELVQCRCLPHSGLHRTHVQTAGLIPRKLFFKKNVAENELRGKWTSAEKGADSFQIWLALFISWCPGWFMRTCADEKHMHSSRSPRVEDAQVLCNTWKNSKKKQKNSLLYF